MLQLLSPSFAMRGASFPDMVCHCAGARHGVSQLLTVVVTAHKKSQDGRNHDVYPPSQTGLRYGSLFVRFASGHLTSHVIYPLSQTGFRQAACRIDHAKVLELFVAKKLSVIASSSTEFCLRRRLAVAGCVHALNQMTVFQRVLGRVWLSSVATP